MKLDASDLALIETRLDRYDPSTRFVIEELIGEVRHLQRKARDAEHTLKMAKEDADDARGFLDTLRHYLDGTGYDGHQADRHADAIDLCLCRILES